MIWKKHTFKIVPAFFLIISGIFTAPDLVFSAEQAVAKKLPSIEAVTPIGEGYTTELIVKLSSPVTYTSYKTISPLRLVIDFSQVTQGSLTTPIVVNKGNFKSVTTSRFDTDAGVLTRMDIELLSDSEAVITTLPTNPGELKISFPALFSQSTTPIPDREVKPSVIDSPIPVALQSSKTSAVVEPSVKTLTSIAVNNNIITLNIDGAISDFKTFRLNNPERYVVDLLNVKSGLTERLVPLNVSGIASARLGLYPDKLRVVLDATNGSFPETTAVKTDKGIDITLGATADVEKNISKSASIRDDKPVAPSEVKIESSKPVVVEKTAPSIIPKPKQKNVLTTVEMIDFQVIDNISRVSVKVSGDYAAENPIATSGYVTLIIKNSILPKKLQRSLETRSFVSPVLRITPLSFKNRKSTDTKIRIAIRVATPFEYRHEGDMLYIDFKHPAGLSGDKLIIDAIEQKNKPVNKKAELSQDEDIAADLLPVSEYSGKPVGASRAYKGRKITLEFADAEVRKIFQLLSEVSNKNFVLGDDVTGAISLKLVNVPWDQALDIILDTKNLDKREDGNIILIKGKGKFKSQADEELEIKKAFAKGIELKTATFTVNYSDVSTIAGQFNGLKTDRGSISTDARTSTVIVKDIPQSLDDMRKLLFQLDVPERQVMIEARIVEATSTFSRNLGVSWGIHHRDGSASFLGINSIDTAFGGLASAPPTSGAGTSPGGTMGISFGTLASTIQIDTRLNAAASAGMVKIISSPKVATLNHKPAKISQGQQIPYQNTTATTGAVTAFVAATLSLEVTPHINANGTIIMKIDAKNDAPGTGSPPPINTKQATTEMLLRDGETTVIGGIYVDNESEGNDGVPYLMDIPFLGNLFKSNTKTKTKTELLIFITPRILGAI
jgi:type IV pilus assembly protein PilQ